MAEHHDRGVRGQARHVLADEIQLVRAEMPQVSHAQRVHQGDQVYARYVEAVPAVAAGALTEDRAILLPGVVGRIVFSRNGEHVRGVQPVEHLIHLIELRGRGQMREIAGVDHEVRPVTQAVDLSDRLGEGAGDIGIGRALEPDVAVADLGEAQVRARGRAGLRCATATWETTSPPTTARPTAAPNQAECLINWRRVME